MLPDLGLVNLVFISGLVCAATSEPVVCPDSSQWSLRTRAFCNSTHPSLNCLYEETTSTFVQFCTTRPDFQRPGYKFIIRGNIDGIECDKNRFQPIKFWTNGSSDCILEKTRCNEPGQVIHVEGDSTSDRTCRCDYTKGFAFVSQRQDCFCDPSLEDCSCFLKPCSKFQVMTPDYNCIDAKDWTGIFKCPVITKTMTTSATTRCPTTPPDLTQSHIMAMVVKKFNALTVTALIVTTVIIIIVYTTCGSKIKKCCKNLNMSEELREQLTQKLIKDQSKMTLEIQAMNYKDILTGINTKEIVDALTLITNKEKHSIEVCQGRRQKNKALLDIVWKKPSVYKEFIEAISQSSPDSTLANSIHEVTDFRNENLPDDNDKTRQDKTIDIQEQLQKELYNQKIPNDVRNVFETYFESWYYDNDKFTVTSATKKIEDELKKKNCVLVVGRSGNGKSAIIRHIALKLFNEDGYDVIPIVLDPCTILQYHDPGKKQLFVIDDFCGKVVINVQTVKMWSLKIKDILNLIQTNLEMSEETISPGTVKLLFATQPFISDHSSFNRVDCLSEYKLNLFNHELNDREKIEMINKYLPKHDEECFKDISNYKTNLFPLLCKLSKGKTVDQILQLFEKHHYVIKQDFITLKQTNKRQICLIALCALLDSLTQDDFPEDKTPERFEIIDAVCSEFDLDFSKKSTRSRLKDELKNLEKTYFAKSGDSFYFEHKEIYDIAVLYCGEIVKNSFIRFASSPFIAERYSFLKTIERGFENLIFIDDESTEKKYFNRLMTDLEEGITYSTFHNSQLEHETYIQKFCDYCNGRKPKITALLNQLHKRDTESHEKTYNNTSIIKTETSTEYEDYIDFKESCLFSAHKMKMPLIESAWEGKPKIVNLLIEMGCDKNETDKFGRSALFVACHLGRKDVVKLLLEKGASHSLCDTNATSPLHTACKGGHVQIVNILLEKKANASKCDRNGWSPLHVASAEGQCTIVKKLLIANNNILQCDYFDRSALIVASYNGKKDVVEHLIHCHAEMNGCDKKGFSPLMAACVKGHLDVVKILIRNKADMAKLDYDGRSALLIACKKGYTSIVDILLRNGANFQQVDWHNQSPLFIACALGYDEIGRLLIKACADISQSDEEGKSPLFAACEKGHGSTVDMLLENCKPDDLKQTDNKKRSPLYVACRGGFIEIVHKLLEKNAPIDQRNIWKETPLFSASREGHVCVVEYLLTNGADLNAKDNIGNTPLLIACYEGNIDIVKFFVKNRSETENKDKLQSKLIQMIRHTNSEDKSALFLACENGHEAIVDILLGDCPLEVLKLADKQNHTPLYEACMKGFKGIVEKLVTKGADLEMNACKVWRKTPLFAAAEEGHFEIVKFIIYQKSITVTILNTHDSNGQNSLVVACKDGNVEFANLLAEKGCDSNLSDNDSKNLLS